MKIRWSNSSVRLRITPAELAALERGESVTEELAVPGGSWTTSLGAGGEAGTLSMQGGAMQILLSASDLAQLVSPENEGVYFNGDDQSPVRYVVEKDFPCAHPRAIDAIEPATETFEPTSQFVDRSMGA